MSRSPYLDHAALTALAQRSQQVTQPCACSKLPVDGWQSQPLSLPENQLSQIGALVAESGDEPMDEPTFAEYHPDGTRYWSPDAPIAARYFPYNRCTVWACTQCTRAFLRYQEGGGYFVDQRIRALNKAALIVDALD